MSTLERINYSPLADACSQIKSIIFEKVIKSGDISYRRICKSIKTSIDEEVLKIFWTSLEKEEKFTPLNVHIGIGEAKQKFPTSSTGCYFRRFKYINQKFVDRGHYMSDDHLALSIEELDLIELNYSNAFDSLWCRTFGWTNDAEDQYFESNLFEGTSLIFQYSRHIKTYFLGIKQFDANGLDLKVIPKELNYMKDLVSLNLDHNSLHFLPSCLGVHLVGLKVLSLCHNHISYLPDSLKYLSNLEELNAKGNRIRALKESFTEIANLKILSLEKNQLKNLPQNFSTLQSLTCLNIAKNAFKSLSNSIFALRNLKILDARKNKIDRLPIKIGACTTLESLNLRSNKIATLPHEISNLTCLKRLKLDGNPLLNLPESLKELPSLTALTIFKGKFTFSPPLQNTSDSLVPSLENRLYNLKVKVAALLSKHHDFTSLKILRLSCVELEEIPLQICALKHLFYLDLGFNKIKVIPDNFKLPKKITILSLPNNKLRKIPKSVSNLDRLEKLFLQNNKLASIPGFLNKRSIVSLVISGNPIIYVSKKIVSSQNPCLSGNPTVKKFQKEASHPSLHPLGKLYSAILKRSTVSKLKERLRDLDIQHQNQICCHMGIENLREVTSLDLEHLAQIVAIIIQEKFDRMDESIKQWISTVFKESGEIVDELENRGRANYALVNLPRLADQIEMLTPLPNEK